MRLYANPGLKLRIIADLVLEGIGDDHVVIDCESGKPITLAELLRAYRQDAGEPELGWIKITIEPFATRRRV